MGNVLSVVVWLQKLNSYAHSFHKTCAFEFTMPFSKNQLNSEIHIEISLIL